MTAKLWVLNPSSLTFLWEECRRCFYLKMVYGIARPSVPMPKIFTRIDDRMRQQFHSRRIEQAIPELPPGVLDTTEYHVQSQPLRVPGRASQCVIKGRMDCVARFDDGTFAAIDFKTSEQKSDNISFYGRQLHAYAAALEHPAPGKPGMKPVKRLGLLVFEPNSFEPTSTHQANLVGSLTWIEIKKDEQLFLEFVATIVDLLELPAPPRPSATCGHCKYLEAGRTLTV